MIFQMVNGEPRKVGSISSTCPAVATLASVGLVKPDGATITIQPDGTISVSVGAVYELGEFYYFRSPTLRPGFQPAQGGLLQQAATLYPEIWAYLQTTEGQKLCTTEAEWQAMTQAEWGDGEFKASWDGIGGAPYFVQNLGAGTLRMPDIRGMFAVAAGDGTIAPGTGEAMGDRLPEIEGSINISNAIFYDASGVITGPSSTATSVGGPSSQTGQRPLQFRASRVVPTGATVSPRAWGALACVYLGQPATA